jgi:phage terminase Nu1 subunit (DNA packaging protein)
LIEKFKAQPNMPVKAIVEEVKDRWGVDVKEYRLYWARRLAKDKICGKMNEQYNKLWDYMETIRRTNVGSCVMMKVDRPLADIPAKFQRQYLSLRL